MFLTAAKALVGHFCLDLVGRFCVDIGLFMDEVGLFFAYLRRACTCRRVVS